MYLTELAAGALSVAIWAYLLVARGGFWRAGQVFGPNSEGVARPSKVAAIVPARNEEQVIARSLQSLLAQRGAASLSIFVVDDSSSDGTAQIVREIAAKAAGAVHLISGSPLPTGWSGKLWAMHQGICEATKFDPDLLLLTDADILHAPDELLTLLSIAESGGFDLASFMVRLQCETHPEKLLMPAFVYFFFMLYPPQWIRDPKRATAGAAGGCMLIRFAALSRAGGIDAIRREVIDDCALARRVKQTGGKVWLGLATASQSLRSYGSLGEIGRMISRTAFNQLQHSTLLLITSVLGMLATFVLPVALLASGHPLTIALGSAASAAMIGSFLPMVRFYRLNPLWALLLPLAALFYMGATLNSAMMYWRGRGGEWKGRAQDGFRSRAD